MVMMMMKKKMLIITSTLTVLMSMMMVMVMMKKKKMLMITSTMTVLMSMMMVIMVMVMMMMNIMNEGASRAQASPAIPCTSEPKSRAQARRLPLCCRPTKIVGCTCVRHRPCSAPWQRVPFCPMCTCYPPARPLSRENRCREHIFVLVPLLSGIAPRLFRPSRWPRPWPLQGSHARKSCRWVPGAVQGNIAGGGRCTHSNDKKTNAETKGDIIPKLFLRVVVPMALKQVLPQPDPCPASSVPRGRLAPAPGVNAAAAGTGDGRRNRLPRHLVEVGSEHVVLHGLWRYLAGTPYPTTNAG